MLGEQEDEFKVVIAMVRTLIAGNWKMNGLRASLQNVALVSDQLARLPDEADCLICPPATLIREMAGLAGPRLHVGGQSCHPGQSGAHTGDISAQMLADAGASHVIVGHSERRADHGETNDDVAAQVIAVQQAGLTPIVCVGESLAQRRAGETLRVVADQLAGSIPDDAADLPQLVVAYEPIWAIGTGEVAQPDQIAEVHHHIRSVLTDRFGPEAGQIRLLYGGSMTPENAGMILKIPDVNGGLVGGASLKAESFMAIYRAALGLD